jgi:3-oxoacyl-[acyl-carrier protein] reductase
MDLGLKGKVAVVTASSSGIGRTIALHLAKEGCRVAICGRDEQKLKTAAIMIETETNHAPLARKVDLTSADETRAFMKEVDAHFGTIDLLVANGGAPVRNTFFQFTDEDWRNAFESNLLQMIRVIREVLPGMVERNLGSIVTISSSSVKQPIQDQWLSNVTRPGLWGFVKSLSLEMAAQGVRINNIAPGRVATERINRIDAKKAAQMGISLEESQAVQLKRIPMGRVGTPEEIADAVLFLLSERASYITGTTMFVDGGMVSSL